MIVLLLSFIDLSASSLGSISSTGVLEKAPIDTIINDSVMISYDDLRTVNEKLVELWYDREKIAHYESIIVNDSIIIRNDSIAIESCNKEKETLKKQYNKAKIAAISLGATTFVSILCTILTAIIK